jgi:hypothetical protein
MKIPMEIPEATVNATKEIVDFEVEAEIVRFLILDTTRQCIQ